MDQTTKLCTFEQVTERIDGKAHFRCTNCGRMAYHCRSEAGKIFAACGRPNVKSPTWLEMAASVAKASVDFAKSGGRTVSGEVFAARAEVCRECPAHDPKLNRCADCGCFLSLKSWLPGEKCPRGKW